MERSEGGPDQAGQEPFLRATIAAACARAVGLALVLAPFVHAPLSSARGRGWLALDELFSSVCHRMPERSFAVFGALLPLCSRCLGLFLGAGLGLLVGRPALGLRELRVAVTVGCAATFVELFTQDLGWHPVFHPTRLVAGFLVTYPLGAFVTGWLAKRSPPGRAG